MTRFTGACVAAVFVALIGPLSACHKKTSSPPRSAHAEQAAGAAEIYMSVHAALGTTLLSAAGQPASTPLTSQGHVVPGSAAPDLDTLLKQHTKNIERLIEATRESVCDFGVDYGQGLEAQMPHLSKVRALARVLRADANRLLADGDFDGAADRIAAIERMAVHVVRPAHAVIELLVASAIAQMGTDFVIEHTALAKARGRDIPQALAAVEQELSQSSRVVATDIASTANALRGRSKLLDLSPNGGRNWLAVSEAERDDAARKLETLQAHVEDAWNSPDAAARLKAIEQQAEADGIGDILSPLSRTRKTLDGLSVEVNKARTTLGN